jgi:HlyD family secretion protein
MDIPRPEFRQKRRIRTLIYSSVAGVILVGGAIALSRLEPAAPSVPRESIWPGTVQRGEMLIQVRGTGNLVTREIRWIPAQTAGRVERIIVRPGTLVEPDTVIAEMSNSDLVQQTDEARFALEAVQADLVDTDLRLKSQQLDQRAAVGIASADYEGARLRAEADRELFEDGIVSAIDYRVSELTVEQLGIRLEIEEERLAQFSATMDAQLSGARARVDQARNLYQRRLDQVESLSVRAGVGGMLREIQVEEGQQVSLGSNIALVARPDDLMAELRISETQARDVQIGQHVDVDTRNGVVAGVVTRIDPAVQNGSVLVDVEFKETLPRGARPDQSVDGTILIEQLEDVVFMGRPTYGQQDATIEIFKMEPDGQHAVRVPVRLGRTSVSDVQIVQGLEPGDEVILSDTTNWESYDRIRLN